MELKLELAGNIRHVHSEERLAITTFWLLQ